MNFLQKPFPYLYLSATMAIIALNLLVYWLGMLFPYLDNLLAMNPLLVLDDGKWWQVITYMYVHDHGDFYHILLNMLLLFFIGFTLEQRMGTIEYLVYYHVVGTLAGLLSLGFYYINFDWATQLMGASGALFGLLLAFAAYFPNSKFFIFFVIPVRAVTLIILYASYELFSQLLFPNSRVAHLTHLAGLVFGYLYLLVRLRLNALPRFIHPDRYND